MFIVSWTSPHQPPSIPYTSSDRFREPDSSKWPDFQLHCMDTFFVSRSERINKWEAIGVVYATYQYAVSKWDLNPDLSYIGVVIMLYQQGADQLMFVKFNS